MRYCRYPGCDCTSSNNPENRILHAVPDEQIESVKAALNIENNARIVRICSAHFHLKAFVRTNFNKPTVRKDIPFVEMLKLPKPGKKKRPNRSKPPSNQSNAKAPACENPQQNNNSKSSTPVRPVQPDEVPNQTSLLETPPRRITRPPYKTRYLEAIETAPPIPRQPKKRAPASTAAAIAQHLITAAAQAPDYQEEQVTSKEKDQWYPDVEVKIKQEFDEEVSALMGGLDDQSSIAATADTSSIRPEEEEEDEENEEEDDADAAFKYQSIIDQMQNKIYSLEKKLKEKKLKLNQSKSKLKWFREEFHDLLLRRAGGYGSGREQTSHSTEDSEDGRHL